MAKIIRMTEHRTKHAFVHFNRTELTLLLNLYARRVASGEWRDYAIDQGAERAVFAIYRHTQEQPLFTIAKMGPGAGGRACSRGGDYVVTAGERVLARSGSLAEALDAIERKPRRIV